MHDFQLKTILKRGKFIPLTVYNCPDSFISLPGVELTTNLTIDIWSIQIWKTVICRTWFQTRLLKGMPILDQHVKMILPTNNFFSKSYHFLKLSQARLCYTTAVILYTPRGKMYWLHKPTSFVDIWNILKIHKFSTQIRDVLNLCAGS